jgi:hypothetical protein
MFEIPLSLRLPLLQNTMLQVLILVNGKIMIFTQIDGFKISRSIDFTTIWEHLKHTMYLA